MSTHMCIRTCTHTKQCSKPLSPVAAAASSLGQGQEETLVHSCFARRRPDRHGAPLPPKREVVVWRHRAGCKDTHCGELREGPAPGARPEADPGWGRRRASGGDSLCWVTELTMTSGGGREEETDQRGRGRAGASWHSGVRQLPTETGNVCTAVTSSPTTATVVEQRLGHVPGPWGRPSPDSKACRSLRPDPPPGMRVGICVRSCVCVGGECPQTHTSQPPWRSPSVTCLCRRQPHTAGSTHRQEWTKSSRTRAKCWGSRSLTCFSGVGGRG